MVQNIAGSSWPSFLSTHGEHGQHDHRARPARNDVSGVVTTALALGKQVAAKAQRHRLFFPPALPLPRGRHCFLRYVLCGAIAAVLSALPAAAAALVASPPRGLSRPRFAGEQVAPGAARLVHPSWGGKCATEHAPRDLVAVSSSVGREIAATRSSVALLAL